MLCYVLYAKCVIPPRILHVRVNRYTHVTFPYNMVNSGLINTESKKRHVIVKYVSPLPIFIFIRNVYGMTRTQVYK